MLEVRVNFHETHSMQQKSYTKEFNTGTKYFETPSKHGKWRVSWDQMEIYKTRALVVETLIREF